jgi:hypothetical protein
MGRRRCATLRGSHTLLRWGGWKHYEPWGRAGRVPPPLPPLPPPFPFPSPCPAGGASSPAAHSSSWPGARSRSRRYAGLPEPSSTSKADSFATDQLGFWPSCSSGTRQRRRFMAARARVRRHLVVVQPRAACVDLAAHGRVPGGDHSRSARGAVGGGAFHAKSPHAKVNGKRVGIARP